MTITGILEGRKLQVRQERLQKWLRAQCLICGYLPSSVVDGSDKHRVYFDDDSEEFSRYCGFCGAEETRTVDDVDEEVENG